MNEQQAEGLWDSVKPYAKKVKFEFDESVLITFPEDFDKPKEMPATKEGERGFCVFDVLSGEDQEESVIMTSSITMLRNLKAHMPLAKKSLMITKKSVGGKTFYYVEDAEQFKAREDATPKDIGPKEIPISSNSGIDADGTM